MGKFPKYPSISDDPIYPILTAARTEIESLEKRGLPYLLYPIYIIIISIIIICSLSALYESLEFTRQLKKCIFYARKSRYLYTWRTRKYYPATQSVGRIFLSVSYYYKNYTSILLLSFTVFTMILYYFTRSGYE